MRYNQLGKTGLSVSQLGFGCGGMGGVLLNAEYPEMVRVVARAIELGVTYFDTAAFYGSGQSEVNLSAVLRELGASTKVIVGTKARPRSDEMGDVRGAVIRSVENSLRRMGRDYVDLIQIHNRLALQRNEERGVLGVSDLDAVKEAFTTLQQQGKARHWGMGGLGETAALKQSVAGGGWETMQMLYSLLNPTAGMAVPPSFPYQSFGQIIDEAAQRDMGVIAIRILAGGALSGVIERHPVAAPIVDPIATEPNYADDVTRARHFSFLIEQGFAGSLVEAAVRFAISKPGVSTALLGISSMEQLEAAVSYVERGPLPDAALRQIADKTA